MASCAKFPGALSTGHGCFPPTPTMSGQTSKTFVNGQPVQTKGQTVYAPHICGNTTHAGSQRTVSGGASKTFIEGNAATRVGDDISCGDKVAGVGSNNTFIE